MDVLDRFLQYVRVDTRSDPESSSRPTTPGQLELARLVQDELLDVGIPQESLELRENGLLMCTLSASSGCETAPHVCLSAHFDTYFSQSGKVHPIVHEYSGGDLNLPEGDVRIPASVLAGFVGERVVTSDGTSLLGADDKAGLAEIVQGMARIMQEKIPHGPLSLLFFPDEECGKFDFASIPRERVREWDVFWTLDGLEAGTIDVETGLIYILEVTFTGSDAHPAVDGAAIIPAHYAAGRFLTLLGEDGVPWTRDGRQGYNYAIRIEGTASRATVGCCPRTYGQEEMDRIVESTRRAATKAADWARGVSVEIKVTEACRNIAELIQKEPWAISPARRALERNSLTPVEKATLGGTDGSLLYKLYPRLIAPNLGTGARNLHSCSEWIPVSELRAMAGVVVDMVREYAALRKP